MRTDVLHYGRAILAILLIVFLPTVLLATAARTSRDAKLHALPNLQSRSRALLAAGTVVNILGRHEKHGFVHVEYENMRGWVEAGVLERVVADIAESMYSGAKQPDRAHQLAAHATAEEGAVCGKRKLSSKSCHDRFPTGCTINKSNNPDTYDAYLNFLKNQTPNPNSSGGMKLFTRLADFTSLDDKVAGLYFTWSDSSPGHSALAQSHAA